MPPTVRPDQRRQAIRDDSPCILSGCEGLTWMLSLLDRACILDKKLQLNPPHGDIGGALVTPGAEQKQH